MTASSTPRRPQWLPECCICNSPVVLETSKTDEYGQAVHEECYVLKLCSTAEFLNNWASTSGPAKRGEIDQQWEATMPDAWQSLTPGQPDGLATMLMQRAKLISWPKRPWHVDLAAVVAVLVLICWIAYGDPHAASFLGSFELKRTTAIEGNAPLLLAKVVTVEDRPKFQTVPIPVGEARTGTLLQEVELAEQRVVQIGEDVTVRYFTPQPSLRRVPVSQYQVVHMGEDVTVRYFTSQPASHRVPIGQYQIVHRGQDVTVRYFTPGRRN